jgi:hypothetical protein
MRARVALHEIFSSRLICGLDINGMMQAAPSSSILPGPRSLAVARQAIVGRQLGEAVRMVVTPGFPR